MPSNHNRVTLQDIARATGYSATAVSRALRGMPDIGPEASQRIRKMAEEMGYVANQSAVSLRYGRTNTVSIILPNIMNPFFSTMATMIQSAAQEKGCTINFLFSQSTPGLELELARQAYARHADGILLFPTVHSGETIRFLREVHLPFVLLAHDFSPYEADCIVIDDEQAGFAATEHLLLAGSRHPAFVSASETAPSFADRRKGFVRACEQYGLSGDAENILIFPELSAFLIHRDETQQSIARALRQLESKGVDGLFVFCDVEAWCIREVLHLPGFSLDSFRIASIDNISGSLLFPAPLCSCDCSIEMIAKQGMDILYRRIQGDTSPFQRIVSPVRMVCHGTCRVHSARYAPGGTDSEP